MLHLFKVLAFLIYILFFLVPLIVFPWFSLRFEPPKVLISEFLIEAIVVYAVFSGRFSFKRINPYLGVIAGLLFLLSLFHLAMDPTKGNLFGNIFRLQGTILFWHLLALGLIAQNVWFSLKEKYIYMAGFLAVCTGAFIFGSNSAGRWIGSLGEPNALGAVVVMMFPFVFLSFKKIWIRIAAVLLALFIINFSESKSAFIGFSLELLFIWLTRVLKEKYLAAFIICGALIIFSLGLPILERQYFLMTNTNPFAFRFEDRAEIWEVGIFAGFKSPIYGSGLESIQDRIKSTAQEMNVNAQFQTIDSAHNLLLDVWIWGGGIGVILILTLIFLTFKNLVRKRMLLEGTVFIGLLTVLSFNPTTVTVLAAFWWVVGRSFIKMPSE